MRFGTIHSDKLEQLTEELAARLQNTKGRKVYVEGTIGASAYTGQEDGKPHASLEMTANEVEFLSSRGDTQDGGQSAGNAAQAPAATPAAPAAAAPAGFTEVDTDELPF